MDGNREEMIQAKNACTRAILTFLEEETDFNDWDFGVHNKFRNVIRYENTRLLNKIFAILGLDERVGMSRHADDGDE